MFVVETFTGPDGDTFYSNTHAGTHAIESQTDCHAFIIVSFLVSFHIGKTPLVVAYYTAAVVSLSVVSTVTLALRLIAGPLTQKVA